MKNIYIILALIFGLQTYAQKTLYVYNLWSTDFYIWDIGTQDFAASYPVFRSVFNVGPIIIGPGHTYILEASPASTTRFPFYSPASVPTIDYWIRTSGPGGPHATLPSNLVSTVYGAAQIMEHVKTQVGPQGSLGGSTLFSSSANGYSDYYIFGSSGMVSLDVIDAASGLPAPDGEAFIIISD